MSPSLPDQARVVVIGAGVTGASVAYHLSKLGWRDVVVLERHRIGCGTTWHSAGNVTHFTTSPVLMELLSYGSGLYAGLEEETGQAVGWRNCGRVMMARTEERMDELRRIAALGRALGIDFELLSPREAGEKLPHFRTDDLLGAAFSPRDGRVNPTDLTAAYVKGARSRGVRFVEGARVTGVRIERAAVTGIETAIGEIACEVLVNCAGLWAKEVGALSDLTMPLHATEHFYMLTKPIDGVSPDMPTFRDPDSLIYGREDVGGLLVGCFDTGAKALPVSHLPEDFAFALLNEDWDQFEPYMKAAIHRIPVLETAQVRTLLNGPESFTPDGNFLMGAVPGLDGYYVLAAMNSGGVTLSGGASRTLAEWIVEGTPSRDVAELDIRRFAPFHGNDAWLRERVSELPSFHFIVHGPDHDFATGRMLRCSVLHDRMAREGAHFASVFGWERPNWFDRGEPAVGREERIAEEYRAAREAVALFDLTAWTKILIEGGDSEALLQELCAADVGQAPGSALVTPVLNPDGGIESLPGLVRLDAERWLWLSGPEQATRDLDWLHRHARDRWVAATDVGSAWTIVGLCGPRTAELLAGAGAKDLDALAPGTVREVEVGYATGHLFRWPGSEAWQLLLANDLAAGAYDALVEVGDGIGLRHAGHAVWEALRLEAARPVWGRELGPTTAACEGAIDDLIAAEKAVPFVGREALLRGRANGTGGAVRCFTLDDAAAMPIGGEPILCGDRPVGLSASAGFAPGLGRGVVMGHVRACGAAGAWSLDLAGVRVALTPHGPAGKAGV